MKTMKLLACACVAGWLAVTGAAQTHAADFGNDGAQASTWSGMKWMVRVRAIGVLPQESDGRLGGAPVTYDVSDSIMPELDITYFFTDNIAAELILGVTPHDVDLVGTGKVTSLWLLPPTLTLQYHHAFGAFKPYVGAGVNATIVFSSDATAAVGGVDDWDAALGFALQAGFDYAIDDKWSLNVDVKKLWLQAEGTVTAGAVPASVDLDPWIIGAGIGYRF